VQAALGLAQVERGDELVARKREIFSWYQEELGDLPGVSLNAETAGAVNSYWMTTVVWDAALGVSKVELAAQLRERGIDTRPFFYPLSSLPAYQNSPHAAIARQQHHAAYRVSPHGLNLPSSFRLTRDEASVVAGHLRHLLQQASAADRSAA
jgi:perosamine synthetase